MKISIIIPVYNKVKYLEKILMQIKNQTLTDYECILIDDGSSDGSEKICDYMVDKDRRFTVIHIPNGGVSHARNVGLNKAKGEYITFIDSDDQIEQSYLENLYNALKGSNADLVISGYQKIWEDGKKKKVYPYYEGEYNWEQLKIDFAKVQKESGIFGFCWGKLLKRDVINGIRFNEKLKLAEDFEFYLKVYLKVNNILFLHRCQYLYLQEAENSSSIIEDDKIDYYSQIKINLIYREFLMRLDCYYDSNKQIVDQKLSDYIFFTIFHCREDKLKQTFNILYNLIQKEKIESKSKGIFRKWIFFLVKTRQYFCLKVCLEVRREIRNIVKGEK